ncbi:MAG TPA: SPOR domain-containing protein [Burkholderiales bacterium]|jgi:cell division septation protein DedD|nr:SPOR domain-containing protein [Burkholderiales bacterium]
MLLRMGFFALLFSATTLLQAAPAAVVEGVQLPAWFTRDGKRQPLATGTELRSNDEIATGVNSRLLLRLGDGSIVKLGENGQLRLSELVQRPQQNFLRATLKVLEGAFRFTTEAVQRTRASRDITVQFPTITAGIRGTDIWGKNLGDKEVLVLIEGKITVTRAGDAPVEMKDPLTYLQAPKTGAATVESVLIEQLKAWAAETEIAAGQGAIRKGGRWKLYLASYDRQTEALALYDSLRRDGYPARILPQTGDDGQRYRVRIAGFPNEQEANALGARLKEMNPRLEPMASLR